MLSRLSAPEPLRLHNFVSRLDQKKAPSLNVGVSTASGSGTTLHDLHRVQLTVPGSLDKVRMEWAAVWLARPSPISSSVCRVGA